MNLSPSAPMPENNYLTASEYAAIVGITISIGEVDRIESAAAKMCTFGAIPTIKAFDTREMVTAYPVTILEALFTLHIAAAVPSPTE